MLVRLWPRRRALFAFGVMASSALASVGCVSALPEPTPGQLAAARATEPDLSLEDLQRGRATYIQRCGSCHALRSPNERSAEAWPLEVQRMQTQHQVRLTPDEQRDILRYLGAASRAP
jgi:mono/diheme cytochrome c family protein